MSDISLMAAPWSHRPVMSSLSKHHSEIALLVRWTDSNKVQWRTPRPHPLLVSTPMTTAASHCSEAPIEILTRLVCPLSVYLPYRFSRLPSPGGHFEGSSVTLFVLFGGHMNPRVQDLRVAGSAKEQSRKERGRWRKLTDNTSPEGRRHPPGGGLRQMR